MLSSRWYEIYTTLTCQCSDQTQGHLQVDFPYIPKAYLRDLLDSFEGRYAPTYIFLLEQEEKHEAEKFSKRKVKLPYKRRKIPFRRPNNDKRKELYDEEFEKERGWVVREVMDDDGEYEGGIECGCCFATYRFVRPPTCSCLLVHFLSSLNDSKA
jgi:TRIAD3 protein (E3 ubiquitin-protein ligase RNF216)